MPGTPATTRPPRRAGAPRKTEHRTGATASFARAVASSLGGASARTRAAVTTFSVDGAVFLAVDAGDDSVVVSDAEPANHIVLRTVGRDELRERIERAWAVHAPAAQVTAYRRARAARRRQRGVTQDDVRRLILALPGATEGPIWGQDPGFLIGTEKRTRFARFGPPEGSRVGNLLPPDDEGTLVLFHCDHKPEVLATSADRWFTTPHYGPEDEPGGIITRLSEHRGAAEIDDLADLIEEAWRHVAPPDLVARLDDARRKAPLASP
jgi:hypothetical protein